MHRSAASELLYRAALSEVLVLAYFFDYYMKKLQCQVISAPGPKSSRGSFLHPQPSIDEEEPVDSLSAFVKLLTRSSAQRSAPKSLQSLIQFVKGINFFKQLEADVGEDAVTQCCLHLTYENYCRGQGDEGSKFYVILEGKVAVYLNLETMEGHKAPTEVSTLGKGESFGELALIHNKPRAATIGCAQDCHFAVLDKADYTRILGKIHEAQISQRIDFLHALPIFHNWTRSAVQKISLYFKDKSFPRKKVLCKVGSPSFEVYFIKEGEVEVLKERQTKSPAAGFKSPRLVTTFAELAILGVGESIGHEEVIKSTVHKFTYVCHSSSVRVLSISKEHFLKHVHSEDSWNFLRAMTAVKGNMRQQRLASLENIDFLKTESRPGSSLSVRSPTASLAQTPKAQSRVVKSQDTTPAKKRSESPQTRLYPFKFDMREYGPQSRFQAIRSLRRLKSWDQIFARKTIDIRAKMNTKPNTKRIVNIHTHSQRVKALHKLSGSDGAVMKTMTGLFFASRDSIGTQQPCLTINTIEMGKLCDRTPSGKSLNRIVRSCHSQFRVKRYNSTETSPKAEEAS